jgi:hypothetical protein
MRRPLAWSTHFVGLLGGFVVLSNQTDASWVDPDTKQAHLTTQPLANEDNRAYELVSSIYCVLVLVVLTGYVSK